MPDASEEIVRNLLHRYGTADLAALKAVLCPLLIPLRSLDKEIKRLPGEKHYRASFSVSISPENETVLVRGRTGKFVPKDTWRELCKGRIVDIDRAAGVAYGEVYIGDSSKAELQHALDQLTSESLLEIDQFGASAKVLSALVEYGLSKRLTGLGYKVYRMPEDMARHLGSYANYDFAVSKNGESRKVEVKSIWGTDTNYARLIHSKSTNKPTPSWTAADYANYYPTSSCKFATQDIFAVSLFLRTGKLEDFAFARSVARTAQKPYGLPAHSEHTEHVNQNPRCTLGDGTWFDNIEAVWNLS